MRNYRRRAGVTTCVAADYTTGIAAGLTTGVVVWLLYLALKKLQHRF